MTSPHT
jgi:hypothetical protein